MKHQLKPILIIFSLAPLLSSCGLLNPITNNKNNNSSDCAYNTDDLKENYIDQSDDQNIVWAGMTSYNESTDTFSGGEYFFIFKKDSSKEKIEQIVCIEGGDSLCATYMSPIYDEEGKINYFDTNLGKIDVTSDKIMATNFRFFINKIDDDYILYHNGKASLSVDFKTCKINSKQFINCAPALIDKNNNSYVNDKTTQLLRDYLSFKDNSYTIKVGTYSLCDKTYSYDSETTIEIKDNSMEVAMTSKENFTVKKIYDKSDTFTKIENYYTSANETEEMFTKEEVISIEKNIVNYSYQNKSSEYDNDLHHMKIETSESNKILYDLAEDNLGEETILLYNMKTEYRYDDENNLNYLVSYYAEMSKEEEKDVNWILELGTSFIEERIWF